MYKVKEKKHLNSMVIICPMLCHNWFYCSKVTKKNPVLNKGKPLLCSHERFKNLKFHSCSHYLQSNKPELPNHYKTGHDFWMCWKWKVTQKAFAVKSRCCILYLNFIGQGQLTTVERTMLKSGSKLNQLCIYMWNTLLMNHKELSKQIT